MLRVLALAAALAAGAAPAASAARWPPVTCRSQAAKVAGFGRAMLVHYDGGVTVYPADMSYLIMRDALARYESHGCSRRVLGAALRRELRPAQRARLIRLLPAAVAAKLRRALA